MSTPRAADGRHLGIVELSARCHDLRARNIELFETLGAWVADTPPGELQRLYAEACHRHAWHAELWAGRAPAIPGADADPSGRRPGLDAAGPGDRRAAYLAALGAMCDDVVALAGRCDPALDPSTVRTAAVVRADLVDLLARIGDA